MSDKTLKELYKDLENHRNFDQGENTIESFLKTVDDIVNKSDVSSLQIILPYFDDNCEYEGIFEGIRVSIEHFPEEEYVRELLKNIHLMIPKGLDFAKTMLARIINDDNSYNFVRKYIKLADPDKFLRILSKIEDEVSWHNPSRSLELRHLMKQT